MCRRTLHTIPIPIPIPIPIFLRLNGAIAILFSSDQEGVGLDGDFFDAARGTAITALSSDGSFVGQVVNLGTGLEFLDLVYCDDAVQIAGSLLSLVGNELAGFGIDTFRFGLASQVVLAEVPEPTLLVLLALRIAGREGVDPSPQHC